MPGTEDGEGRGAGRRLRPGRRLGRALVRIGRALPPGLRALAGLMLIAGGLLGFLPVLGFWMIPLGIGVVWLDIRALRRRRRETRRGDRQAGGAEGGGDAAR